MIDLNLIHTLEPGLQKRLGLLQDRLVDLQPGIIAVSGGLDSRFLSSMARAWNLDFRTVFLSGPHLTPNERRKGRKWVQELGLPCRTGTFSPLEIDRATENTIQRCYHCKQAMIRRVKALFAPEGPLQILEGSHASDQDSFRPGQRALRESGVHSPLADAGLNKSDLRTCAHRLGLAEPEQPSRACLLTRFAYGLPPDVAQLNNLGQAEDELLALGLNHVRIRQGLGHRTWLQVDEGDADLVRQSWLSVRACLARFGFDQAELLLTSGVSGFFDRPDQG